MTQPSLYDGIFRPQPLLVVLSGPSGVGKDAILKALQTRDLPFHFVVTMTSRPIREGEQNGVDYNFVTTAEFEDLIKRNELLEHAVVYQQYKGIPKAQVREAIASGKDVLLRIDVQGAKRIRSLCPDALTIFLVPESEDELIRRIRERKTESEEQLAVRLETARGELEHLKDFDYMVVNSRDQLDQAVDLIVSIIQAEHHRVNPRRITL